LTFYQIGDKMILYG